jgi:hypothetical protein
MKFPKLSLAWLFFFHIEFRTMCAYECASGIWMATNDVCHNSHTRAELNVVLLDKLMG